MGKVKVIIERETAVLGFRCRRIAVVGITAVAERAFSKLREDVREVY